MTISMFYLTHPSKISRVTTKVHTRRHSIHKTIYGHRASLRALWNVLHTNMDDVYNGKHYCLEIEKCILYLESFNDDSWNNICSNARIELFDFERLVYRPKNHPEQHLYTCLLTLQQHNFNVDNAFLEYSHLRNANLYLENKHTSNGTDGGGGGVASLADNISFTQ